MSGEWYELIWPLDKRHYLSPSLRESDIMSTASSELTSSDRRDRADDAPHALNPIPAVAPAAPSHPSTTGRDLAGRALLAGCSKSRTRDLLGVSSRTVGRIADADLTEAWHDADAVEQARACLAETADRGSTAEEREAAEAWLRETVRDARQVERVRSKAASRRSTAATATRHGPAHRPHRNGTAPPTTGRDLAGRALLAGCSKSRTRDLLGVSSRTVGRIADADLTEAWHDADAVEQARACLAETADRGSTAEEREAAEAWLRETVRDARQVERVRSKAASRRSTAATATRHGPAHRPHRNGTAPPAKPKAEDIPTPSGLALEQVDALTRQQRRILHRSALIDYVLAAEKQGGQTLTMGDALGELLGDITEAARTIGAILQQVGTGRPPRTATTR